MHDSFIGTPCFLSIRVLYIQCKNRSVVDDIESLLYVLIYFVAKDIATLENAPMWEKGLPAKQQALLKAAAFINIGNFSMLTGLDDLEEPCLKFLLEFAKNLFIDKTKGTSIMNQVLDGVNTDPRESYNLEHWLIELPQKATSSDSGGGPRQPQAPAAEVDK
ncbi:hypothetical protein EV182_000837 [Spiromyces aspiralis]|uniref:Uncharacterized protein n=1 Tax=Spiromyces aspiralis TaxID=68401 RepID=A0ACC1HJ21_9FUNG|nr:hypothetical protein EV182_000837 [Spiromyces aspiralis]